MSQPLVDGQTNKVIGVVVRIMGDPCYTVSANKVFKLLDDIYPSLDFTKKEKDHCCEDFSTARYGILYGQGSKVLHWLNCTHEEVFQQLLHNKHIKCLEAFANYASTIWASKVYNYYETAVNKLSNGMPALKWNFWNSAFFCITFNFGPYICCTLHEDYLNLPFGWCAIIALGNYDYTKGSHLVLHDLKLIIEFPPSSLIPILSALLTHSNTPLDATKDFMTEADLESLDSKHYVNMTNTNTDRKRFGLGLWSTLDELLKPVKF
ncbi:hypothetical protein BJ165DRAFT_1535709 [Panaeolus papilionaceus]|nr:hypothetical protein BJ165DRAFT_1535709 [Panaeolus papilionaceus]